jgi:WD40 repeat protein
VGRTERRVDPEGGPVQRFAWDLRQLRESAGRPSYRVLASRAHYSASMLSEAAAGLAVPSLAVTLAYAESCGGDRDEWEKRWHRMRAELAAPPGEHPPYLGLTPFEEGDAERFFGRGALTGELVERLSTTPLLAVFGASGSGKSSLLRAGLLPRLHGRGLLLTPGAEPLQELAAALARFGGGPTGELLSESDAGPAVRRAAGPPGGGPLVLVVDQFEEVFTLCRDERVRRRFIGCLLAVADGCADRARVVLGVRADFYAHCARHAALVAALRDRQLLVGPMDADELRAAVTGPAEHAGLRAEPGLVDAVVADAADQPGALPLVSHALLETWRRRQGRTLTLAGYRAAGGVAEAISQTAERVYAALDPTRRELTEHLFLRLTALGDGTEDTRRRVPRTELPDHPAVDDLLERLAAARLITCDRDTVTVAHEALIRRWPRLRDWLTADRDLLRAHRRLTEATAEWEQHGRDEAFLYRGKRLAPWDDFPATRLNQAERAFLDAGRRREHRETNARRRRTRLAVSLLSAVVTVVTALATISTVQARRAAGERDTATADALAAESREQSALKPELALLLARKAMTVRATPAAEAALRQATVDVRVRAVLATGHGQVFGVAYSPDGQRVATSGDDGTVRVWHTGPGGAPAGPPQVLPGHAGEVWSPQFGPGGRLLAACGIDHTITLWDLVAGGPPRILRGHTGKVWNVAFSPDGRRLASTSDDGTVRLWPTGPGGGQVGILHIGRVRELGVAYSNDGRHLAASDGDGVIRVWNADGTGRPVLLRGHTSSVENIAFTPDGRRLASASTDGTARVWAVDGHGDPVVLRGQNGGTVETVAISPDGYRVAAGGSDGTVRVFNAGEDADPLLLAGHDGPVWSLAFDPRGGGLLSGSGDGTTRFWDASYPGDPRVLRGHDGPVWSVAATPDGRTLVTGGDDGTVRVWPATGSAPPRVLRGHRGAVEGVAIDPGGTRVAGAGDDGTVQVWDLAGGPPTVLGPSTGGMWDVAFLPGSRVAGAGGDGVVRVWDTASRTAVQLPGNLGAVRSVAASPDGRYVAAAGRDGTVRLWDMTGATPARVLRGHRGGLVWRVAFSPDGRQLASGGDDGTIRLWDVAGVRPPVVLRGHRGGVWSLAFNPAGTLLASSGDDGGVRIWRPATREQLVQLHGFGSPVDGVLLVPGGGFATVHEDGTLRLASSAAYGDLPLVRTSADRLTLRDFTPEERAEYLSEPR